MLHTINGRTQNTQDTLENTHRVVVFLQEGLCGAREVPLSDTALGGAQLIFWEVQNTLERLREQCMAHPENTVTD